MSRTRTKVLLVEGHDDLISVVELMSEHVAWPEDRKAAPVQISDCKGLQNLLDDDTINAALKTPGLVAIGIMLDADDSGGTRWGTVRAKLLVHFPKLPEQLPKEGLVFATEDGRKVGVWIMPDNNSPGSLETFLSYLVPVEARALWNHALESVVSAEKLSMPCKASHLDKARLYTWLAWQDPPGQLSGRALTKKVLDPKSGSAETFVKWFIRLFEPALIQDQ